jgi:hypothetical protein
MFVKKQVIETWEKLILAIGLPGRSPQGRRDNGA